jgi:coproporphyrinogen III oxidase-like Fe-S oxidoreductase
MYKDKVFHIRKLADILEDIDMAKARYGDVNRVFLCDGDAIFMKQEDLLTILEKLYRTFPSLERVNTYAGPRSTLSKTPEQLKQLRQAGLVRAYLGVETGSDALLKKVKKGVTAEEMLEAGVRLRQAGFDLWDIVLMGLAGPGEASREHALATAEMVNRMKPRHLSAMTYMVAEDTEMEQEVRQGKFQVLTPEEALGETRLLIEHLETGPLHFTSDHASNYLPLKGTLPDDREKMLALIDDALEGKAPVRGRRGL